MIGAACAERASSEGMKVLVVEPGVVGGGVTAASMGHLVAVDGAPAELALAGYSETLWESLRDLPGSEYDRCGTLWVAADEADMGRISGMRGRLAAAGVTSEAVDAAQLRRLEPALAPSLAGGLLVASEGIVYPPAVARELLARACRLGAEIRRARAIALGDHALTLDDGERVQGTVLVATGAAVPELLPELPLRLRKGHLVITERHQGLIRHQLVQLHYADSAHGETDSVAFNVQPRPTGQILIGSSREYDRPDPGVSLPMVRRMLACAFAFVPALRHLQALRIWTGQRPASVDGLPYLGPVPTRRGVWVAAGHEGHGICTAPGSARLLVDRLLGRETALDMRPYDPARVLA
ncbi:MAG TPA: FAD-dependent oxidoreductase [Rhodanobacteraceae bacterium]|nr:FAD-dependent oxidoreductase [Rhodanobacteraceae bacterium]